MIRKTVDSKYINKVFLYGQVYSKLKVHYLNYERPVVRFTLFVCEKIGKNRESFLYKSWHKIVAYDSVAENVIRLIEEGTFIFVEGRIVYRNHSTRNGITQTITEIRIDDFELDKNNEEVKKVEDVYEFEYDQSWMFDHNDYTPSDEEPII